MTDKLTSLVSNYFYRFKFRFTRYDTRLKVAVQQIESRSNSFKMML